ncbi:Inactive serine protease [Trichinella pseudospiralis]
MSRSYFKTFDSWALYWKSTQTLWFILVEEDRFPHLRFRAVRNEMGEWKFYSTTTVESKSHPIASSKDSNVIKRVIIYRSNFDHLPWNGDMQLMKFTRLPLSGQKTTMLTRMLIRIGA